MDCEVCLAMREGRESFEAQLSCGHCPACYTCPKTRLMQVAEGLRQEWRDAYAASLKRTRGMFE